MTPVLVPDEEEAARLTIGSAIAVHTALGPGLLESVYEACLAAELAAGGARVERQKSLPVVYRDVRIEAGFRMDIVVGGLVVVEVEAVDNLLPVHESQLATYLKLSGLGLGLLINFDVPLVRSGIRRIIRSRGERPPPLGAS